MSKLMNTLQNTLPRMWPYNITSDGHQKTDDSPVMYRMPCTCIYLPPIDARFDHWCSDGQPTQ